MTSLSQRIVNGYTVRPQKDLNRLRGLILIAVLTDAFDGPAETPALGFWLDERDVTGVVVLLESDLIAVHWLEEDGETQYTMLFREVGRNVWACSTTIMVAPVNPPTDMGDMQFQEWRRAELYSFVGDAFAKGLFRHQALTVVAEE